jgi:flagellar motor protein MotB
MLPGGGMEAVPIATPLVLAVPESGSIEVSCALPPPAGAAGKAMWIFYHPMDQSTMFKDVGKIADIAARAAKERPDTKVKLTGHACSLGSPEHNKTLADRRAQAVKQRMISLGIAANRIVIESEGEEAPVCPNETRVGRMHNRRTEIRLVGGNP